MPSPVEGKAKYVDAFLCLCPALESTSKSRQRPASRPRNEEIWKAAKNGANIELVNRGRFPALSFDSGLKSFERGRACSSAKKLKSGLIKRTLVPGFGNTLFVSNN